jgi:ABC-type multidrug transport system fused ATPase/permease subunit
MFTECVQNVQPLAQFGQTGRLLREYDGLQHRIVARASAEVRLAATFGARRNLLISATRRIAQGIWVWQYQAGVLDAPAVMYLAFLTEELIGSFWSYASVLERVYDGVEPARVLVQLAAEQPAIADSPGARHLDLPGVIEISMRNVTFAYQDGPQVLKKFALNVEPGTVVGLVGRSGVGKTTIQNLLSRMLDTQAGKILVGGVDVRHWELGQLRGLFAVVSQNGAVFFSGLTVQETIRFSAPDATLKEVIEAAECACIHDEILEMPSGYETRLGQGGVNLSKGQAQRLGVAQALLALRDRKVLVLDEFTSALDAYTEAKVIANLRTRIKGKTVIMIAHRLATVQRLADKIVVIDEGGVIEEGTHRELVNLGERYAELVKLQSVA